MAIAFIRGHLNRDPFVKEPADASGTLFAACSVKETYRDRNGEERLGGYHDVIAFGDEAAELALLEEGDELEVKASIRYRPDRRSVDDNDRNPFTTQFVVMEFLNSPELDDEVEDDPFAGA